MRSGVERLPDVRAVAARRSEGEPPGFNTQHSRLRAARSVLPDGRAMAVGARTCAFRAPWARARSRRCRAGDRGAVDQRQAAHGVKRFRIAGEIGRVACTGPANGYWATAHMPVACATLVQPSTVSVGARSFDSWSRPLRYSLTPERRKFSLETRAADCKPGGRQVDRGITASAPARAPAPVVTG